MVQPPLRSAPARLLRRGSRQPALLVASAAAAAGVAVGAALPGHESAPAPADGVAPAGPALVRLVDSCIAAMNATDPEALSAAFADEAVLTDLVDRRITTGAESIGLAYGQTEDLELRRTSDVVVLGEHVTFSTEDARGPATVLAQVDDGVFVQYVVTGGGSTP